MEDEVRTSPRLVALLDQLEATLKDAARLLGGYRTELIACGFDSEDALELCRDVQLDVILEQFLPG